MNTIGFYASLVDGVTLDMAYLSGVSITHGPHLSRQHIWSFASAEGDNPSPESDPNIYCPCMHSSATTPLFVGDDYFCDTGNHGSSASSAFLPNDSLWDGEGCSAGSTCCTFNNPPWFCKALPEPTTDDLEVRLCHTNGPHYEFTPIEFMELYVQ